MRNILLLVALAAGLLYACQKSSEKTVINSGQKTNDATAYIVKPTTGPNNPLITDREFNQFYGISKTMFAAVIKTKPVELNDNQITYKECKTLAPKLGFKDSAALVNYVKASDGYVKILSKRYGSGITSDLCTDAMIRIDNGGTIPSMAPGDPKKLQDCYMVAYGTYTATATGCFGLLGVPVGGPVLAGTCYTGALILYIGMMNSCRDDYGPTAPETPHP